MKIYYINFTGVFTQAEKLEDRVKNTYIDNNTLDRGKNTILKYNRWKCVIPV